MNNKLKKLLVMFLCTVIITVSACGQSVPTDESMDAFDEMVSEQEERKSFDWSRGGWKLNTLSPDSDHVLYVTDYIPVLQKQDTETVGNKTNSLYSILGSRLYILESYTLYSLEGDEIQKYDLKIYDDSTGEVLQQQITFPNIKEYAEYGKTITAFDMINEQKIVLFVQCWSEEKTTAYLAAYMDTNGKCEAVIDLYPVMLVQGICPGQYAFDKVYADGQGFLYVIPDPNLPGMDAGKILVLDTEGQLVGRIGSDLSEDTTCFAMKAPDGKAVFEVSRQTEDRAQFLGYDAERGEIRYADVSLPGGSVRVMTEDGYLFYGDGKGKLFRWDLYQGVQELCMDYKALGIGRNEACLKLMLGADGEPLLLDTASGEAQLYRLGTNQSAQKETIRLVSLAEDSSYISACSVSYSQSGHEGMILLEQADTLGQSYTQARDTREDFRTRALAELTVGKGADIYYVSAEDMDILYEKNVLADLSEVLSAEDEAAIYPGVLASGVIDGRQIGLAPSAYVNALMVRKDLCQENQWNWETVLRLYDAHSEPENLIVDYTGILNTPMDVLTELFLPDLNASPFVDLEMGTCDFQNPLFIQILEFVNQYDRSDSYEQIEEEIQENRAAAFRICKMDFVWFSNMMEKYGEQYDLAGFPSETGNENYWECEYFLVVNQNTQHMDQVKQYLSFLFRKENQAYDAPSLVFCPVRGDMLAERIVWNVDWNPDFDPEHEAYYDCGNGIYSQLPIKAAGISWLEEYEEMLNTAVPHSGDTRYIQQIISEETAGYFSGDRDAETVAQLIQNRVQLYLHEQN